jgi:5-formyltetrahydrofolate cyclo-ligase
LHDLCTSAKTLAGRYLNTPYRPQWVEYADFAPQKSLARRRRSFPADPTVPVPQRTSKPAVTFADADDVRRAKALLRADLLASRLRRSAEDRAAVAVALARSLEGTLAARLRGDLPSVAAYLSVGAEPGTGPLIGALAERGVRTIVPVLTETAELDWTALAPDAAILAGLRGTVEPDGPRLGGNAIAAASIVLVPAVAVDLQGHRLGRGGGSYDRALALVGSGALVLAVVHDDEVVDAVPVEAHDRPVHGALTPGGVLDFQLASPTADGD